MATRIDNINERRARRQAQQAQAPSPLPPAAPTSAPTEPAASVTPSAGMMPAQPVAASQVSGRTTPGNAPVPTINPESTTQESMRRVALQNMDEAQFKKAQEGMNASDKEYWSEQARLNPLNTYANLQNYFASEETPEEQRKRKRREHLGQVFSNLGNLIGNAAQLYYTAQGAESADLNRAALMENERMRRIKEKRDALKAKQDALLAEAKGNDIRNAYNIRLAREKAAADAEDKAKEREQEWRKFGLKLNADKAKADADREIDRQRIAEQSRHNRALEANASRAQDKIVDSVIGADGNIYTRNTKMSENEARQIVNSTGLNGEDLKPFITRKLVKDSYDNPIINEEVDWMAAAAYALENGMVYPEELRSRGFKLGGKMYPDTKRVEGFGSRNKNGKKTVEGF